MDNLVPFESRERPRRDGTTSASSHPELVTGEFAVPPRPYVSATAMQRSVAYDQRRAMGAMLAIAAIALLLLSVALRSAATAGSDSESQRLAGTCMRWHLAASAVVSRQVQSMRDVDLLLVSNAIDRMRRARRNCELGQVALACQDYYAVASGMPGMAMSSDLFPCARLAQSASNE